MRLFNQAWNWVRPATDKTIEALLLEQAVLACTAATLLRKTKGRDLKNLVDYERQGDALEDSLHVAYDTSFIKRLDQDALHLSAELDDMLDGMRKVATHVDTFGGLLAAIETYDEIGRLFDIICDMTEVVRSLVLQLSEGKLQLDSVKTRDERLEELETDADSIRLNAVRDLVRKYQAAGANHMEYEGWKELIELLERVTDSANHCGSIILSLARKGV